MLKAAGCRLHAVEARCLINNVYGTILKVPSCKFSTASNLLGWSTLRQETRVDAQHAGPVDIISGVNIREQLKQSFLQRTRTNSENTATGFTTIDCNGHALVTLFRHEQHGITMDIDLNNPKKANTLDRVSIDTLTQVFEVANTVADLRCIVLGAKLRSENDTNPSFCAGADLKDMSSLKTPEEGENFIRRLEKLCFTVSECPVPTIGAIDGNCFGAGMELAACCDIRFATSKSRFAMPEIAVGIPSVIQARHLVDIMGWPNARYLMLFGSTLDSRQAEKEGFINQMYGSRKTMYDKIDSDITRLLEYSPKAIRSQKQLLKQWKGNDPKRGIDVSVKAFADMWRDDDHRPGEYMARALGRLSKKGA